MNISGYELASVAGITSVKQEKIKPTLPQTTQLPTIQVNPLQNNPNENQIAVNTQEETQTKAENVEETVNLADKNLALKQNNETETKELTAKP